jgi:hypothetical protein
VSWLTFWREGASCGTVLSQHACSRALTTGEWFNVLLAIRLVRRVDQILRERHETGAEGSSVPISDAEVRLIEQALEGLQVAMEAFESLLRRKSGGPYRGGIARRIVEPTRTATRSSLESNGETPGASGA